MKVGVIFLFLLSCVLSLEFYVDGKNGNDANAGTQAQPFATIEKAQSTIRALQGKIPPEGIQVQIREGDYFLPNGLTFTSADDGNITYTGYKNEKVRLLGSKVIPVSAFKPTQGGIYSVSLMDLGITNYGDLAPGGLGTCNQNQIEVFFNSKPMIIARYPNIDAQGHWIFDNIVKVLSPTQITYNFTRPSLWTTATDLWLHGYWSFDWADSYVKVASINTATSTFNIASNTPPVYGFLPNARFYALNLLEELDAPNEYFVDRNTGILYIYPPSPLTSSDDIMVSLANNVITGNNIQFLKFDNLGIFGAREAGIQITGSWVSITNSIIANHGHYCIDFPTGINSTIYNNVIYGCGCGGLNIYGGVQKSLSPGYDQIASNEIYNYARIVRTYNPGIHIGGVGHSIFQNYIHDAPHNGILTSSINSCAFVSNRLKSLCFEATDCGAFYSGRSWIDRGNMLISNTFQDIYDTEKIALGWPSVQAVYLDDQMSGWQVDGNTFQNCQTGIVLGGGRDTNITGNSFQNCTLSVHFDNRGMNWQNASCKPGGDLEQQLESVNYQHPPWSTRYPELVNIMNNHPCVPVNNLIIGNNYCATSSAQKFMDATAEDVEAWYSKAYENSPNCNGWLKS